MKRCSTLARFLLTAGLWLGTGGLAHAHGLEGEAVLRPGWQVQVESWYETGDAPAGARVEVLRQNGSLLTEGKLNDQGIWLFSLKEIEPLRIVIRAGGGHRKDISLTADALLRQGACTVVAALPSPALAAALLVPAEGRASSPVTESVVPRAAGPQWTKLFIGVVALLAVATVAVQWRKMRSR
ncbi:MAG: hypothetical protein JNM56_10170 [Planctomycetia bacterium]|nr:hypothetical protein [Planctomycetia bacterium]